MKHNKNQNMTGALWSCFHSSLLPCCFLQSSHSCHTALFKFKLICVKAFSSIWFSSHVFMFLMICAHIITQSRQGIWTRFTLLGWLTTYYLAVRHLDPCQACHIATEIVGWCPLGCKFNGGQLHSTTCMLCCVCTPVCLHPCTVYNWPIALYNLHVAMCESA